MTRSSFFCDKHEITKKEKKSTPFYHFYIYSHREVVESDWFRIDSEFIGVMYTLCEQRSHSYF